MPTLSSHCRWIRFFLTGVAFCAAIGEPFSSRTDLAAKKKSRGSLMRWWMRFPWARWVRRLYDRWPGCALLPAYGAGLSLNRARQGNTSCSDSAASVRRVALGLGVASGQRNACLQRDGRPSGTFRQPLAWWRAQGIGNEQSGCCKHSGDRCCVCRLRSVE
jgi:hypothetical protein